jgi:hypothetical protein
MPRDPALEAVHRQAAKPGVADPNAFARWDFDGEELSRRARAIFDIEGELAKLIRQARRAGWSQAMVITALRDAAADIEREPEL